jgi:hypothetical protein
VPYLGAIVIDNRFGHEPRIIRDQNGRINRIAAENDNTKRILEWIAWPWSDPPTFYIGHEDSNDGSRFSIPIHWNGVDTVLNGRLTDDDYVKLSFPDADKLVEKLNSQAFHPEFLAHPK